jgi:sugar phosphate isomerase/epimerase
MARLLDAADELGMAVIVSLFYCGQIHRIADAQPIMNAVRSVCAFLREGGWYNVIIEVANEYDIGRFQQLR